MTARIVWTALAAMALLSSCSDASRDESEPASETELNATDTLEDQGAPAGFASDSAEEKGGETYAEYDARRDSYEGARGTFAGDGCTVDCGGHQAGYKWAESRGITDANECGGKSWSFEEGCRSYAEENSGQGEE